MNSQAVSSAVKETGLEGDPIIRVRDLRKTFHDGDVDVPVLRGVRSGCQAR